MCNPVTFRALIYSQFWHIQKLKHIQNPAEYLRWNILLRNLCKNNVWFRRPIYSKLSHIRTRWLCIGFSLGILAYYCIQFSLIKKTGYSLLLAILFFSHPLSIWATGLLITHTIVDICQNLGYSLRVKRKEKHLYIRKCSNITNNSQKIQKIPRNNNLFKINLK